MSAAPTGQSLPLRGKRILVTRPEGQADKLLSGICALGGQAAHIPFLAIEPCADPVGLAHMAHQLSDYRACLFISVNAVQCAWPGLVPDGWPKTLAAAAVGPGTVRALRARGVSEVIVPASRFDSEGLLAEPFFAESQCRGRAFALIRGDGGRDLLAQTLRARGATRVDEVAVYRRCLHPEALSRLAEWLQAGSHSLADMILISSSESLQRVMAVATATIATRLRQTPLLVPHPKIADCARALGFSSICISDGGDDGLLHCLRSYNDTCNTTIMNENKTP
ncbi:MAG: uroporphyrinogen-III synthase [Fluviibacter sp.]|jgi:uroporphyrinogen-III synthase